MSIYDFDTCEDYLKNVLAAHKHVRGYRTRLSKALSVHPSYITRVLAGATLLTPDQAAGLAEFWALDPRPAEYFHWLVMKARAGNKAMKATADRRLRELRRQDQELDESLSAEKLETQKETDYCLHWLYPAVHILSTIPALAGVAPIARHLGLPEALIANVGENLQKMGLIEIGPGAKLKVTTNSVVLPNRSWMSSLQHRNWRSLCMERLGRPTADEYHYSGVHSLSRKDLEKLHRQVREFLLDVDRTVRTSKEEVAVVLLMDLFDL